MLSSFFVFLILLQHFRNTVLSALMKSQEQGKLSGIHGRLVSNIELSINWFEEVFAK